MIDRVAPDVPRVTRRQFLAAAAAAGATGAWASRPSGLPGGACCERRDLFPEGVASGDPDHHSVLLWTRRPFATGSEAHLRVEIAEDPNFERVVATAKAKVSTASDWTCRVLVGNLRPARVYSFRFIDAEGNASRIGRTVTAPAEDDPRPVKFAIASCQNINMGALHAYRRMIFEDERAPEAERLSFVLHLGDFVYEAIWYPQDNPQGLWGRPLYDVVRYPQGEQIGQGNANSGPFHIPVTLEDYRALYRAYLHDPDLQDARARWPFVCMWDNHEFSWSGWQSVMTFAGKNRPAQTRKVAANQAWFEYQPARATQASGKRIDQFDPPQVRDAPIERFDAHGLGVEPNNLAAIASLTVYRGLRWGRNVELLITDQHSYCSEEPSGRPEAAALASGDFPQLVPQEAYEILDAGRAYGGGKPPATIRFGDQEVPNFRKDAPPQTVLGAEQKNWLIERLKSSRATWKIWGNSRGVLDQRADPQELPAGICKPWPGATYAELRGGDPSTAFVERAEIYGALRDGAVTGFAVVSGDRHSFWAGLAAPALPPQPFEPVGVAFVSGSISSPGLFEVMQHTLPQTHPLRALYIGEQPGRPRPEAVINMLLRHGVRSCLEYQRTADVARARRLSNPDLSPHVSFVDCAGHGYACVRASSDALECEFVCIPRPADRNTQPDGGPILYRVVHRAQLWKKGQLPRLEQRVVEGNPTLSI